MSSLDTFAGLPFGAQTRNPFNYVKFEQIGRDVSTHWLTLEEISQQINLFDDESQDSYLNSLELAVRQAIEDYLGLSIFSVTYRVWYGPESLVTSPTSLDLPEVSQNQNSLLDGVTINQVAYYTADFKPQLLVIDPANYFYDGSGNKVIINSLPTNINNTMTGPIMVDYTTAPNPLQSYPVIKQAGLLLFTHLYNNRSNTTGPIQHEIPFGVATLLRPYKPLVM